MIKTRATCPYNSALVRVAAAVELHAHKPNNATRANVLRSVETFNAVQEATEYFYFVNITRELNIHA